MTLRDWLRARPFTLTMSAGFFSFFAHVGVISVLADEGLLPARITGASAGAIAGALWGAGCDVEMMKQRLFALKKADFWDPGLGLGFLKGERFRDLLSEMAPVALLEDCAIPVTISVYQIASRETKLIATGDIGRVVLASSCVPFLFQPVRLNGRLHYDGGILDRPGLAGTQPDERVFYHHITSRSPWRRQNSSSLQIPQRDNLVTLAIPDLPRAGPNKLERGPVAFAQAREAMQVALERPL
jgi:NTE family protein